MKIKAKELLSRKASVEHMLRVLESLDTCDKASGVVGSRPSDAEGMEATLEEYAELLDALLESAEVSI